MTRVERRAERVTGGLHSFVYEIARISRAAGPHYSVRREGARALVVMHHLGKWSARVVAEREVVVETNDGHVLRTMGDVMELDGRPVEMVCAPGYRCLDAAEIRQRVAAALALWELLEAGYDLKTVVKTAVALTGEPP
jgi:hypothetical protein